MRNWFLNHLLLVAAVLFAIVMCGVRFTAHQIYDHFGWIGALITIAAMYFGAREYERRKAKADLDSGLIESTRFERLSERPANRPG